MIRLIVILILSFSLILTGCGNKDRSSKQNQNEIEYTKLTSEQSTEQQISNQAKDKLKKREEITSIHAVNTIELLVLAFEVSHFNRFNLVKLRKEIKKELEKEFPKTKITVSTDKKIILELQKLEEKLQTESMSEDKLNKKLKKIKELSKEET